MTTPDNVIDREHDDEDLAVLKAKEQDRQHLRALLMEGMSSPLSDPVGPEYFAALRHRVLTTPH
jgi:hypothetical protein